MKRCERAGKRVAIMGEIRGSDMTDRRPGARRVDEVRGSGIR